MTSRKKIAIAGTALAGAGLLAGGIAFADGKRGGHWGGDGPRAGMSEMFEQVDRDGDGKITRAEAEAFRDDRLRRFDSDKDGVLSLEEYRALWAEMARPMMVRGFQRHDADGDARLTADELGRPIERMFSRMDADGDGAITRAELRQRFEAHKRNRDRHRDRDRDRDED